MAVTFSDICKLILAVILPPVGVFVEKGRCDKDVLINILLTVLGYIPGIVHAVYIIVKQAKLMYVSKPYQCIPVCLYARPGAEAELCGAVCKSLTVRPYQLVSMDDLVGSLEELEEFDKASPADRKPTPALRGILAEMAATGLIRYDWKYLHTLVAFYLDQVLLDYEAESAVEVGPPKPLPGGETPAMLRHRLRALLADQFPTEAPFTIQRLAELLLEPHKHYSRLDKLALALEKLILVTSTITPEQRMPPRPKLTDLPPINCNPRNPTAEEPEKEGRASRGLLSDPGFGLASAVLASSSRDPHHNQQGTPELEEGMGHLNEAGVAARAAPQSPGRETQAAIGSPLSPSRELANGQQDTVMTPAEPP